jgi:(S)-ureidoglycine aminohydrolase
MQKSVAVVHIGPALGSAFTQYTAEMQAGGTLGHTAGQRFLYVLDGEIRIAEGTLGPQGFSYIPENSVLPVQAKVDSRVVVIEKRYLRLHDAPTPAFFLGCEQKIAAKPLAADTDVLVRTLVPEDATHDFAVNTMTYEPGASLSMVELHIMEHGLLMLEGAGIYRLANCWYPVTAGDFIWMAPYCPQWFGALGKVSAKYLIYKDWNRHPL